MKKWEELTGEEKSLVEKRWNDVKNNRDEHMQHLNIVLKESVDSCLDYLF